MAGFTISTGFDRSDGVTPLPSQSSGFFPSGTSGTPNPSIGGQYDPGGQGSALKKVGNLTGIEEEPDSPEIERAEQGTFMHRFKVATWSLATQFISMLGRGTFLTDSYGNRWRVLSSKIQSQRGGAATCSITAESLSFDSPPDEFSITPVELNVDIMKHPRYNWALLPWTNDQSSYTTLSNGQVITYNDIKQSIIRQIQVYRDAPYLASGDAVNGSIQTSIMSSLDASKGTCVISTYYKNTNFDPSSAETLPSGSGDQATNYWVSGDRPTGNFRYYLANVTISLNDKTHPVNIARAAALEILSKLWRGEDTPPVTGYEIVWSQYYFAPVFLDPGNYIQSPWGVVPMYFMSPDQSGATSIFNNFTFINPQCFAQDGIYGGTLDFSCLRKPDECDYQRTWFKVTRKWLCSPVGHWDTDLLTNKNRPQYATDYHGIV